MSCPFKSSRSPLLQKAKTPKGLACNFAGPLRVLVVLPPNATETRCPTTRDHQAREVCDRHYPQAAHSEQSVRLTVCSDGGST